MNASKLIVCSLAICTGAVQARTVAGEEWVGEPLPFVSVLTRGEVLADLDLWIRSGMSAVAYGETFDPATERVAKPLAAYNRLRKDSVYADESSSPDVVAKKAQDTAP